MSTDGRGMNGGSRARGTRGGHGAGEGLEHRGATAGHGAGEGLERRRAGVEVALRAALRRELPAAVALRRELHAAPRVSGQEGPTLKRLLDALPGGAVEHVAGTGAVLRIGGSGPAVGVRGELDALPIVERTGVPWAAANGAMHACGHDVHLAAVVALARAVAATASGQVPELHPEVLAEAAAEGAAKAATDAAAATAAECGPENAAEAATGSAAEPSERAATRSGAEDGEGTGTRGDAERAEGTVGRSGAERVEGTAGRGGAERAEGAGRGGGAGRGDGGPAGGVPAGVAVEAVQEFVEAEAEIVSEAAAAGAVAAAIEAVTGGGLAPLVVVLQPREETYPSGASDVVESGVLERQRVHAMIGAHVQPILPEGTIACTPGPVNASSDEFRVTVKGADGHAAYPHLTRDPVLAMSQVIVAAQQLVSRAADPMTPTVVTFGTVNAGTTPNAVPGEAVARGTLRTMSQDWRVRLHGRFAQVAEDTASAYGCAAEVEIMNGEPILVNDHDLAVRAGERLREHGWTVNDELRSCGADDFARYGDVATSLMMFVGVDTESGLHSPSFLPGDDAVGAVAEALLAGYLAASTSGPAGTER
ncbi:amidohydrolase [Nonomuraea sp. NPDC050404]|uniref:M20 metallopeptidase family protein n=1 Tax=Nonomuraea sp. NPDC050404 TaxID=3155783 RepID=UPI0033F7F743